MGASAGASGNALPSLSAGEFLNYIENRGNKESADEGLRHHAANYRRAHDLARDRACSGRCPERHAAENKGERGHHEGPEAKPRRGKCGIHQGHAAFFIVFLCKCDDQNRVFRSQADEHYQADLGVDIVLDLNHVLRQVKTELRRDAARAQLERRILRLAC